MFKNSNLKWAHALKAFLAVVVLLSACKKNDNEPDLSLSFEKAAYSISPDGNVIIKLKASGNVGSDITVPVSFSGTAVKGTDYTVPLSAFVIKKGTNYAEMTIATLPAFSREKTIKVDMGNLPAGVQKGEMASTIVEAKGSVVYSFEKRNNTMTETADVKVQLGTANGPYVVEKEIQIPIIVDASSTAVEGVHFEFEGAKQVVISAGKSAGMVKLKLKKHEAGKDKIILSAGAVSAGLAVGANGKTTISIFGSSYNQLKGSWSYSKFANLKWLSDNTGYMDNPALLPVKNTAADILTFDEEGLKVQMAGDLRNYFRNATMTNLGEENERLQELPGLPPPMVKLQIISLSAANVAFSAKTENVRETKIGFRYFKEGSKEMLEVTIRDYEPTDFLQNTWAFYKTDPDKMKTMPIRLHFEKVAK